MSPTKTAFFSLSLALLTGIVFSGCASKNITIIGEKRVDIVMHKSIQEGSLLKVVAELENDDFDEVEGFVYQIEWYDMNG
ncbi:MAG TPA: hypothetical protein CFH83_09020, partial [Sulfuricurvum kujiense]